MANITINFLNKSSSRTFKVKSANKSFKEKTGIIPDSKHYQPVTFTFTGTTYTDTITLKEKDDGDIDDCNACWNSTEYSATKEGQSTHKKKIDIAITLTLPPSVSGVSFADGDASTTVTVGENQPC